MKKTVNYKGKKIKVDFVIENHTRTIDDVVEYKGTTHIKEAHGTEDFIINGKRYIVKFYLKGNPLKQKSANVKLDYKGFICPDNDKKMIEHILSVHGL